MYMLREVEMVNITHVFFRKRATLSKGPAESVVSTGLPLAA
jgi:hypothetical protein